MTWHFFKHYLFSPFSGSVIRTMARICIFGVGVGVMAMVIVLSVMNGFGESIRERLFTIEPHLVATFDPKWDATTIAQKQKQIEDVLARVPGGRTFYFEQQDVILRTAKGDFSGAQARGLTDASMQELLKGLERIRRQAMPSKTQADAEDHGTDLPIDEDAALGKGEILLGVELARNLNLFEGDEVMVISPEALLLPSGEIPPYEKVTIQKVLRSNLADVDSQMAYYRLGESMKRLGGNASLKRGVEIKIQNAYDHTDVSKELNKIGIATESWEQRNAALFYSLKAEKLLMSTLLGLTIFIASFSIVIVLVLLGLQKRRDIGILMSMGLSSHETQKLFTRVGMLLAASGMVGGLILGVLVCIIGQRTQWIQLPPIYYDTRLPFQIDVGVIFIILCGCLAISYFAASIPAKMSTRLTPTAALRG